MHEHSHGPDLSDAARSRGNRVRLALALGLVLSIVLAQSLGAWFTGSLALLVDLVHSFTDSIGLMVALAAAVLMTRAASKTRTWGFRRIEVLASLAQAVLLLVVSGYAVIQGVQRLADPPEVAATELFWFAVASLIINLAAVAVLYTARGANLNMRAAFLEVMMDALGTLAVIISALTMMITGFQQADTIAALAIAVLIVPRAIVLLWESVRVLMEFAPEGVNLDQIKERILEIDHVVEVHDLHASLLGSGFPVLSSHVVLENECFYDGHSQEVLTEIAETAAHHSAIAITHITIQLETAAYRSAEEVHPCN